GVGAGHLVGGAGGQAVGGGGGGGHCRWRRRIVGHHGEERVAARRRELIDAVTHLLRLLLGRLRDAVVVRRRRIGRRRGQEVALTIDHAGIVEADRLPHHEAERGLGGGQIIVGVDADDVVILGARPQLEVHARRRRANARRGELHDAAGVGTDRERVATQRRRERQK